MVQNLEHYIKIMEFNVINYYYFIKFKLSNLPLTLTFALFSAKALITATTMAPPDISALHGMKVKERCVEK